MVNLPCTVYRSVVVLHIIKQGGAAELCKLH